MFSYLNLSSYTEICPKNKFHNASCFQTTNNYTTLTFNYFESSNDSVIRQRQTHSDCIYKPNDCSVIHGQAHGEHLMSCESHICPNRYFKCPGYYCISWKFVCNGHWECPGGTDEVRCDRTACPGMFRCKNSSICISKEDICDSVHDCQLNDDENFCSKKQSNCPSNCSCLLFSLFCEDKSH